MSSENCTYFESSGSEVGACSVTICKCDSSVCQVSTSNVPPSSINILCNTLSLLSHFGQLRLDFDQFMIAGPSTATVTTSSTVNGNPGVGVPVTLQTRCLTDTFSVTNPGGITPPEICGINTGEHSKYWSQHQWGNTGIWSHLIFQCMWTLENQEPATNWHFSWAVLWQVQ